MHDQGSGAARGIPGEQNAAEDTIRNFAYPLRVQPRPLFSAPSQSAGVDGNNPSGRRSAPSLPVQQQQHQQRQEQSPSSSRIGSPSRPPRPLYVPTLSGLDVGETNTAHAQPGTDKRSSQQQKPARPLHQQQRQLKYSSLEHDNTTSYPHGDRLSVRSDRSIFAGVGPENLPADRDLNTPSTSGSRRQPPSNISPPSSRRGIGAPYFSQQTMNVSPIPEEPSLSRKASYASSAAIPASWHNDSAESHELHHARSGSDEPEGSLVRHASVGKREKPKLTDIKSPERSRSRTGKNPIDYTKTSASSSSSSSSRVTPRSPLSPASPAAAVIASGGLRHSPVPSLSSKSSASIPSPLSQPPIGADGFFPPPIPTSSGTRAPLMDKDSGTSAGEGPAPPPSTRTNLRSETWVPGRRIPNRLNIDAVSRSGLKVDPRVLRVAQGGS